MKRLSAIVTAILVLGAGLAGCASGPAGGGWVTLFDGRDFKNWYTIGDANWRIEDGAAVADKLSGKQH